MFIKPPTNQQIKARRELLGVIGLDDAYLDADQAMEQTGFGNLSPGDQILIAIYLLDLADDFNAALDDEICQPVSLNALAETLRGRLIREKMLPESVAPAPEPTLLEPRNEEELQALWEKMAFDPKFERLFERFASGTAMQLKRCIQMKSELHDSSSSDSGRSSIYRSRPLGL